MVTGEKKEFHKKNEIHRLKIDGYSYDGAGIARLDGMAVFVAGALSGETCDVQLLKVGKSASWGRVVRFIEQSPGRVASDCPHYPKCGGCQTRHMSYAEELEFKRQRVEDALRRIGGAEIRVPVIFGANNTECYRNKAQFPVGREGSIGFYRARSHDVIDVPDCRLQSEPAHRLRAALKGWMEEYKIPAYDEENHKGLIRHLFVRTNRTGQSLCCIVANGDELPHAHALIDALQGGEPGLVGIILSVNKRITNVILGDTFRTIWGQDFLEDTLCGLTFRLSTPSFFQVNREQTEVLYQTALEFAELTGAETVLDLYCGVGTITLVMAKKALRAIGAEVVPEAVEDARDNAVRNGVHNAEFICADAGQAAKVLSGHGIRPDVICVDPPRKGLAADVIDTICAMAPKRLVYVSCDPATLARDIKLFGLQGYVPTKAVAVDLFPRTHHVETVVLMSRVEK
ncbi:23S rRNA (uracil-C(5))-methyltransferase RlmCD [bioreactor metagenome]|uniref:23S rRNA (Uracil-C(5))-methyltransferase RlmCD n=1 Tax=bioreactor metagenome TaxID=1076179 RepID=A0A644X7T0_9ZZZZ